MRTIVLVLTLVCCQQLLAINDSFTDTESNLSQTESSEPFLLSPPQQTAPVVVWAHFKLHDVNEINDEAETFEFTGILTLKWRDPRLAFDPNLVGAREKIFQGNYQFNELSPGWYPQEVLINESGMYQKSGVILRIQPDGTSTLIQTINAVANDETSNYCEQYRNKKPCPSRQREQKFVHVNLRLCDYYISNNYT